MDPSKESNLTSLLRPQFFCTRPNGCVTPLIALDELPPNISIRGTYRYLSPNETAGMTSVGTSEHRSQFYIVEGSHVNPVGTSVTTVAGESNMNDPHQRVFNGMLLIISLYWPITNAHDQSSKWIQLGIAPNHA